MDSTPGRLATLGPEDVGVAVTIPSFVVDQALGVQLLSELSEGNTVTVRLPFIKNRETGAPETVSSTPTEGGPDFPGGVPIVEPGGLAPGYGAPSDNGDHTTLWAVAGIVCAVLAMVVAVIGVRRRMRARLGAVRVLRAWRDYWASSDLCVCVAVWYMCGAVCGCVWLCACVRACVRACVCLT